MTQVVYSASTFDDGFAIWKAKNIYQELYKRSFDLKTILICLHNLLDNVSSRNTNIRNRSIYDTIMVRQMAKSEFVEFSSGEPNG